MLLIAIVIILLIGGVLAWSAQRINDSWPRWISLSVLLLVFVITAPVWFYSHGSTGQWLLEYRADWIPAVGISLHLAIDGLGLVLVLLTLFLGIISVASSWREIRMRVGFFHFNLLWALAGITGVFMSLDLFLFYFFWELMLIPMYFIINIWGHEKRVYASYKFFIFTQAGGLLMLISILALYFIHASQTGVYTFGYTELLAARPPSDMGLWLMLGFFAAFAVKIPSLPFHTWLPDAHTEAPTAGSVILAGLLLKTGAYGFLRFVLPLFPEASASFAPVGMMLGAAGIIYGAVLAFSQRDVKRLVAYTSVSHMGFVLLGVFAGNELSLQGAVMQMISHGLSTGALFIIAGMIQERIHTRDMYRMEGLWQYASRMGGFALFFCLASLGLPGMANFIAEMLVLIGSYRVSIPLTVIASVGMIASAIYSLWLIQRVFHGKASGTVLPDLSIRETLVMTVMMLPILWFGLFPQVVLDKTRFSISAIMNHMASISIQIPDLEKASGR